MQLTGSAQWAFLIAGPCFGLLSDKYDRRRTVLSVLAFMTALTLVLVALLSTSLMIWPLMYLYMVMASMCTVLDTTNRPAMIYDLLFAAESEHLVTTAMGLRALGFNVGRIFGPQLCGWIVDHLGLSAAWVLVAAMLGTAAALLMLVPSPPKADRGRRVSGGGDTGRQKAQEAEGGLQKVGRDLLLGLQLACQDHAFLGVLGVTIICNLFCASPSPGLSSFALTPAGAAVVRLEPHAAAERDRE